MTHYTSIEQSKHLLDLGLSPTSADMKWRNGKVDNLIHYTVPFPLEEFEICDLEKDTPCWSLAALLEILDFPELSKDRIGKGVVGWMVSAYPKGCRYDSNWHSNAIDACYEMILKLHEQNLL